MTTDVHEYVDLLRRAAPAPIATRWGCWRRRPRWGATDLLADEPYAEWVLADREHYRSGQVQALVDLAEACLELADWPGALGAACRACVLELT